MSEISIAQANDVLSEAFAKARYEIAKLEMPETTWDEITRITSQVEFELRFNDPKDGYCEHGTYVGGCMADYMCGYCEAL